MVAFDAAGPDASGAWLSPGAGPLTWSHAVGGTGTGQVLLVAVACDADATTISSVTWNSLTLTQVPAATYVHSNGQSAGWISLWKRAGVSPATANVSVTFSTSSRIEGGSLSFTEALDIAEPQSSIGSGTTTYTTATGPSLSNTDGSIIAGFAVAGSPFSSATSPSTSRFNVTQAGASNAGGYLAGATTPAAGSPVAMEWTISSADYFAVIAAEVLAVPTGSESGPNYAGSAADLGGGTGAWASPANATGAPDATWATWTAP